MNSLCKNYISLLFVFNLLVLFSCITPSKIKYLQVNGTGKNKYKNVQVEYLVQKEDNLYIKLSSIEPTIDHALSVESGSSLSQGIGSKYLDVYQVDKSGLIKIPQLDSMKVEGKSLQQIQDTIEFIMKRFYSQGNCQVRLADNFITLLGDVNKPGRFMVDFRDKINIFDLIGMAGDLNFEAKRNDVKLVRKRGMDTEIISLDLTSRKILESEYYYIMPNDIIYVEPLRAVSWNSRSFPFITTISLILSTTTSIFFFVTYFKK